MMRVCWVLVVGGIMMVGRSLLQNGTGILVSI